MWGKPASQPVLHPTAALSSRFQEGSSYLFKCFIGLGDFFALSFLVLIADTLCFV